MTHDVRHHVCLQTALISHTHTHTHTQLIAARLGAKQADDDFR